MTTTTATPRVSTLMPTLNAARFFEETLASFLAQTYDNLELVVVDGGSTDETVAIAEQHARANPGRIKVVSRADGSGPCARRNVALEHAEGELICWLDADDLWSPTKVAEQVQVMRERPEVGLVYSDFETFDSDTGRVLRRPAYPNAEGDILAPLFVVGCFVGALTVMFRRAVLDRRRVRLRDSHFAYGDDYQLWLVLTLDWQVVRIDRVLARYRRHEHNESLRQSSDHPLRIELLEEYLRDYPEARDRLGRWRHVGLARHYRLAAYAELAERRPARMARYLLGAARNNLANRLSGARG